MKQKRLASKQLAEWRAAGVPLLVTASEAYRLTDGLLGDPADHHTPVPLAAAALAVVAGRKI